MTTRCLGYLPDAPDARDHLFSAHRASAAFLPSAATVDHPGITAKNQGSTSSCVGQAVSQALRLSYLARMVVCPELSALNVYRFARNIDGSEGDIGTFLRSGCYAVQRMGCATEDAAPFVESRVNDQPSFRSLHSAFDRGGTRRYYRIAAGNTDAVRRAIAAGFPVVGGWSVDAAFVSSDGRGIQGPCLGEIIGGHAMTIVGYVDELFTILGSWGSGYGHDGRIEVTRSFVAQGTDLWALDTDGDAP